MLQPHFANNLHPHVQTAVHHSVAFSILMLETLQLGEKGMAFCVLLVQNDKSLNLLHKSWRIKSIAAHIHATQSGSSTKW